MPHKNKVELLALPFTKLPKTAGILLNPDKKFEVLFNVLVKNPPTPVIGRDNANDEGNEPLYRVYKVGPVKLYTVESILRL